MIRNRRPAALAALLSLTLLATACAPGEDPAAPDGAAGELVDLSAFAAGPWDHLDPALGTTVSGFQVINALYDGLTDIDFSDPGNPEIVPLVAESFESNEDATVWTFRIRDDVSFSNGEQVLPSSFLGAWERASSPGFAGDYSYLFNFIEGGAQRLAGDADTISGVQADDENMTLTVTLAEPYAHFDALVGFQIFAPMPTEAIEAEDFRAWERGIQIGNGPYKMAEAPTEREIVLVRNEDWAGDAEGNTFEDRPERITFRVSADVDSAFNAFEAGEGDISVIPPGRAEHARANYGTTLDVSLLGSYHFIINQRDPRVGGERNRLLRQAISQAIDREEINEAIWQQSRTVSTGIVPPGIPGFRPGLCDYCAHDPVAARAAFEAWRAAGNSLDEPLPIQFNADAGHEPVLAIVVDNLAEVGIEAVAQPMEGATYFSDLAGGACVICRAGWIADYPAYDNFMYDLFHTETLDANNFGFSNAAFDRLVDEAKRTADPQTRHEKFRQAESLLLNEEVMAIPIAWFNGDKVYDEDKIADLAFTTQGLILWERVRLAS